MSLLNDALKQARQVPPPSAPSALSPLQPVASAPLSTTVWLLPAFVIILLVSAVFFIGWSVVHRSAQTVGPTPKPVAVAAPVAEIQAPVLPPVAPPPAPARPPAAPPTAAPVLPKLQGILYSPTAPSAIVAGKTVRKGDQLMQYRVQEISKNSVTLQAADGKLHRLTLDN